MESVGSRIKSAREKKGISVEQAQKDTRIHSGILLAVENDRIREMVSGTVYARSFIKKYANYLGLDGEKLAQEYSLEHPSPKEQISTIQNKKSSFKFPFKQLVVLIAAILVFLFALKVLIFAGVKIIAVFKSRPKIEKKAETVHVKENPKRFAPLPAQTGVKSEKPAVATAPLKIPKGEELTLTIKAQNDVWIKIKADNSLIYEGALKRGSADKWKAKEAFNISTSRAEALILELNGTNLVLPGKGVAKNITITANGIKK